MKFKLRDKFFSAQGNWAYAIPILVLFAFIAWFAFMSYDGRVQKSVQNTKLTWKDMQNFSNKFDETLQKNFYGKFGFIDMNGLLARKLGLHTHNKVQRLGNGHLTVFKPAPGNMRATADKIELINNFLKKRGIEFLYVLAPNKNSMHDVKFAKGYGDPSRTYPAKLIAELHKRGIWAIDMDSEFQKDGWGTDKVFFRTDHHWMPQAAFKASQKAMALLTEKLGLTYKKEWLDIGNYNANVYKKWFLGSHGQSVGKWFAGTDDITIFTPKFPTDYAYNVLGIRSTDWKYNKSPLSWEYVSKRDYFRNNPHATYLDGQRPIQVVTNSKAPNKQRVLFLGDSFRRTFHYFLTTQFQGTCSVEVRVYEDGSMAQFIEEIQPDIVILLVNTEFIYEPKFLDYGISAYEKELAATNPKEPALWKGNLTVSAPAKAKDKFEALGVDLMPGKTYTVTVDGTELKRSRDLFVQMSLQNLSTGRPVLNRYFNANSSDQQKWIFTVPKNQSDTFAILLYAGVKDHTNNAEATVSGISVKEGIIEFPYKHEGNF
ncbi:MAG: hypothetical protein LUC43_00685 [Burkholderiales bacterium]|nr:hypothetical protein [Burkholderiales bacterium]